MEEQKIIDRFLNLKFAGLIKGANGVGLSQDDRCGDTFKIYIKVENDEIVNAKFKAFGNPIVLALGDLFCENIVNKSVDEAQIYAENEFKYLLENLSEDKIYCLPLFGNALNLAIKKYKKKLEKEKKNQDN